ncbi:MULTISPECIES: DNA (cytosine-5-)-methyltransferase [Psychrilyobacter]|uniref:DNA (cytosine-5-)-methyltransferase n=1 Tax=Psychrilyobacter TaxID=623282 RepID=UPI0018F6DF17|nr:MULTISPECIES: DNA (cytosine-5-)-methyltransferase [Psychrilyobacter]MCS5420298.1 DNA (cytosine-5-)-methyltransferase [Psychrilyobacter sp. S5]
MKYKVGSLFAGVGGVCLGFKRASEHFELTFANEMDKDACKTYKANFNHSLIEGDIEKILNPEIVRKEREFLLERSEELKKIGATELEFDIKIVKDAVKKLDSPFFVAKAMKGGFELTDSIQKKIVKNNYSEEKFKDCVELQLILNNLVNYTEDKTEIKYQEFKKKNIEITKEKIDILTGGFPCQAFSIAGDRKGFSDHRGELFYSVINLVNQLETKGHGKPRVLFLENVKNLVSHEKGQTFKIIQEEIEKLGYTIKYKVLNTYKYTDLPQNRERIFVICFLNKADSEAFGSFEDIQVSDKSREELKEIMSKTLDYSITKESNPEFYYTKEKYPNYFMTQEEFENSDRKEKINLNEDMQDLYEIYQIRRGMYVRKNQSGVCPTLTANMGTGGHNVPLIKVYDGIRKLSPKDCFNLQGFRIGESYILPKEVKNASLYKQSGNAVSVDVIELIAKKIEQTFIKNKTKESIAMTFLKEKEKEINKIINNKKTEEEIKKFIKKLAKECFDVL